MSTATFPIERKKMFMVFAIVDMFVGFARFFMMPEMGIGFHIIGYFISLTGFCLLWESVLFSGKKLEAQLPMESHPYARFFIQTFITYFLIIFPSFFIELEISNMLRIVGYLFYFLVAAVLNLMYFGIIYFFNWKENLVNLANIKREQATVKYDALRNQLNPHFLFNALTSLNSLIFENQQLASDFLQQLSKVYRYVLQSKEKATVSLSTELDFISHYIFLLKTRFGNGIEFQIILTDEVTEKEIVPVTLQILIENAMKHNVVSNEAPLKISISIEDTYLAIVNSVNKKTQVETSNKQGLENLKSLYQYLTEKPIEITEIDGLFKVRIPLI